MEKAPLFAGLYPVQNHGSDFWSSNIQTEYLRNLT